MAGTFQKVDFTRRPPDFPAIEGDSEIAHAFESRDVDRLKQVLAVHPESWRTHLVRMKRTYGNTQFEGNAVHFALQYGWAKALDPLHQAGASLQDPHAKTGYTPLQMAAYLAYPAATKWLVKHNSAQSEEEIQKALALVVLGVNQKSKRSAVLSCAKMLVSAGANVWSVGRKDPLPIECLKKGYPYLAAALIEQGEPVPPALEDEFARGWVENLNHGSSESHFNILHALFDKGAEPSLSWLSREYVALATRMTGAGTWVGREPMIKGRLAMLIGARIELGVDAQDALQAAEDLRRRPEMGETVALLEQQALHHYTPQSRAPRARRGL